LGIPDEVAKAVVFLASDDRNFINGAELLSMAGSRRSERSRFHRQAMVWSMYEIVKLKGRYTERLPEAPFFEKRADAEKWARDFLERHPERFAKAVATIEVRWVRVEAS
jgi:hypothetical protein